MKDDMIIQKIVEHCNKILYYTNGMSYKEFSNDAKTTEACVFNLGQIGEMAAKLSKSTEDLYSDIPWKEIYGLRNRLIHDYEGVNLVLIWEIISNDIPDLLNRLQ